MQAVLRNISVRFGLVEAVVSDALPVLVGGIAVHASVLIPGPTLYRSHDVVRLRLGVSWEGEITLSSLTCQLKLLTLRVVLDAVEITSDWLE